MYCQNKANAIITMNIATTIAAQAKQYIDKLNGENEAFEIEHAGYLVFFNYEAETGEDPGDNWTAPSWWIGRENIEITEAWDADGNECPEIAEAVAAALKEIMNA